MIKVGDKVKVLTGKDKGKVGTVTVILKKQDRVVVSGVNIVKKHMKPNATNETGGILSVEAPIHVSNVKVIESNEREKKTTTVADKKTTKKTTKKEVGEE